MLLFQDTPSNRIVECYKNMEWAAPFGAHFPPDAKEHLAVNGGVVAGGVTGVRALLRSIRDVAVAFRHVALNDQGALRLVRASVVGRSGVGRCLRWSVVGRRSVGTVGRQSSVGRRLSVVECRSVVVSVVRPVCRLWVEGRSSIGRLSAVGRSSSVVACRRLSSIVGRVAEAPGARYLPPRGATGRQRLHQAAQRSRARASSVHHQAGARARRLTIVEVW